MFQLLPSISDRVQHYLFLGAGMFLVSFIKVGFDYIAKKTWRKIDHTADELKAFREWKKTHHLTSDVISED